MPKTTLERNTFVRGLITEASALTYPENASIDEDNFILNRDGSRQRRLGMDYERDYALNDTLVDAESFRSYRISGYKWKNVANDATQTFSVIHVGTKLYFFDNFEDVMSANLIGSLAVSSLAAQEAMQYAAINGGLVVANKAFSSPKYIEYNKDTTTFSEQDISIKVRDIWGVDDGLAVDERPEDLSIAHEYNLFNQAWPTELKNCDGNQRYPHDWYHTRNGQVTGNTPLWPSNNLSWWLGIDSVDDRFEYNAMDIVDVGTREPSRGRIILDAFNRGIDRRAFITDNIDAKKSTDAITDLPEDSESGTITTVAAYAGRIFYSGVDSEITDGDSESPSYAGMVFFSRTADSYEDLSKCHTINDTTSEDFPDLLPTDGGTINIPEASRILKLINVGTSLVVIAENGVWEINGPDNVFKGDDFFISQITNTGAFSADSVVQVEGSIFFWGEGGIYQLAPQDVTGRLALTNISETTIQSFYIAIPSVGRANATGIYDEVSRKIRWLYNDETTYGGVDYKNRYNRELVLDTVLGAFYTNSISKTDSNTAYVAGYIPVGSFSTVVDTQNVVVNGEQVVVNGEDVVVSQTVRSRGVSSTKYIAVVPGTTYNFTFSLYRNDEFVDWFSQDSTGISFDSYLITGYELFQDTMRRKYVPYLVMHFQRTESGFSQIGDDLFVDNPSSCLIQARWDWNDSDAAGKWGTQFQAYRLPRNYTPTGPSNNFDYGYTVITTKNRLRGSGRAISMRLDSEAGKDMYVLGWGIVAEGGMNV